MQEERARESNQFTLFGHLDQACQTGGPMACLMRPAVTYLN